MQPVEHFVTLYIMLSDTKTTRTPNTLLPVPARLGVSVPADVKDQLYQIARDETRSVSSLILFIIMDYLERRKKEQK